MRCDRFVIDDWNFQWYLLLYWLEFLEESSNQIIEGATEVGKFLVHQVWLVYDYDVYAFFFCANYDGWCDKDYIYIYIFYLVSGLCKPLPFPALYCSNACATYKFKKC